MKNLKTYIEEARGRGIAIGHFNISNWENLKGIFEAAKKLQVPVIIGTAEGEQEYLGTRQAVALVRSLREQYDYPVFLNADHTYSLEKVREAVIAGYDAVIFDGTKLSFEDNIKEAKACVDMVRKLNPDVLVEAEIGFIGSSSKVLDEIPKGAAITEEMLTKPAEALRFVKETGVDLLAPAIGNIHGMLKGGKDPALNIKLVQEIYDLVKVPLVLHGASGNSAEDIQACIKAGVAIVHINTEIRVAYKQALKAGLDTEEVAPYRYLKGAVAAVEKVTEEKLKIFNFLG